MPNFNVTPDNPDNYVTPWSPPDPNAPLYPDIIPAQRTYTRRGVLKMLAAAGGVGVCVGIVGSRFGSDSAANGGTGEKTSNNSRPDEEAYTSGEVLVPRAFSTKELARYAKNTEFGASSPLELARDLESTFGGLTLREKAKEIIGKYSDTTVLINKDPSTGEELPHTRSNRDLGTESMRTRDAINLYGVTPKAVLKLASTHNLAYDFLNATDEAGLTKPAYDIAGAMHAATKTVTIVYEQFGDPEALYHELAHTAQMQVDLVNGEYARLREEGRQQFGSPTDMLVELNEYESQIDPDTFHLAKLLVDNAGISCIEDQASAVNRSITHGLLPDSDIPILQHLYRKQMVGLSDFARVSGVDILAQIAFTQRFGTRIHPKLIAEIDQAGIIDNLSTADGSTLSDYPDLPINTNDYAPGTHFVNIGTVHKPEIIVIQNINASENDDNISGQMRIDLIVPVEDTTVDLSNTPTTSTLPDQGVAEQQGDADVVDLNILEQENTQVSGILAPTFELMQRVAPSITLEELSYTSSQLTDHPDMSRHFVTVNAETLAAKMDRLRIFARINKDYKVEIFDIGSGRFIVAN